MQTDTESKWIQVRLSRDLAHDLREIGERMERAAKQRPLPTNEDLRVGKVSLGDVILRLASDWFAHQIRNEETRKRKKARELSQAQQEWEEDNGDTVGMV